MSEATLSVQAVAPARVSEDWLAVLIGLGTFFSSGVMSNFRQLREEGLGKLAAVYAVSLFDSSSGRLRHFLVRSSPTSSRRSLREDERHWLAARPARAACPRQSSLAIELKADIRNERAMTIDWTHFTPLSALAGGVLIGLAAAWLILENGRILGASGLLGGLIPPRAATGRGGRRRSSGSSSRPSSPASCFRRRRRRSRRHRRR